MFVAKPEAERAGFRFWKPLVWDKRTIGMGYHYRARYEFILFFEKGKRRLSDLGRRGRHPGAAAFTGGYPAEKPVAVSEVLVTQSSEPGELVADPFMGSGSIGVAALQNGRRFTGTDINPEAVRMTTDRLAAATASPRRERAAAATRQGPSGPGPVTHVTGAEYANLVASYIAKRFGGRGLKVYREVRIGKTIIAKNRCVDVFCVAEDSRDAFAIECKFQDSEGTVDEKIPYALDDLQALPMRGCIAYAGKGFSKGVLHMLEASPDAAYCLPLASQMDVVARHVGARPPDRRALQVVGRPHRQEEPDRQHVVRTPSTRDTVNNPGRRACREARCASREWVGWSCAAECRASGSPLLRATCVPRFRSSRSRQA